MAESNTPPPGGTAELIENSQAQVDQELEDKVGAAIADSLEDEEQPAEQQTKTDEGQTTSEEEESKAESEKETESEEEAEPEPEKPTTVKLKDGTEVTFEELERGFLRQSDYTRKTQELSNDRKQVEAAAQRLIQQDQVAKQELAFAQQVIQSLLPKEPDLEKLNTDPVGYLQQKAAYDKAMGQLQHIRQFSTSVDHRLTETDSAQTQSKRAEELQLLTEKIPSLRTEQGRTAFFQEASDIAARAYGFTPEEIGSFGDHRYILALRDAVEYRKLQSKKMEAVRKAKEAPPMKPAGRQEPNARAAQGKQAAWEKLRQEGTEEAAAAALPDSIFS